MKITYLGTTMLLFDDGKDQILFDCHTTRPSIRECLTSELSTDIATADRVMSRHRMDRLRAIFISHSHHDHALDLPYYAEACGADVYGSPSALNIARGGGIPEERLHVYPRNVVTEALRRGRSGKSDAVKGRLPYEVPTSVSELLPPNTFTVRDYQITVIPSLHSKAHFYNNDLGQTIDAPVVQPAKKSAYKEGGSFDFLVEHQGKKYLIRPSYNYIEGQLDGIRADVLFLGIAGLAKDTPERQKRFFEETIAKVKPTLVIPVHWDNFFTALYGPIQSMPAAFEDTGASLHRLAEYCGDHQVQCLVQLPLTSIRV